MSKDKERNSKQMSVADRCGVLALFRDKSISLYFFYFFPVLNFAGEMVSDGFKEDMLDQRYQI